MLIKVIGGGVVEALTILLSTMCGVILGNLLISWQLRRKNKQHREDTKWRG